MGGGTPVGIAFTMIRPFAASMQSLDRRTAGAGGAAHRATAAGQRERRIRRARLYRKGQASEAKFSLRACAASVEPRNDWPKPTLVGGLSRAQP